MTKPGASRSSSFARSVGALILLAPQVQVPAGKKPPAPRPPLPKLPSGARGFEAAPQKSEATPRLIAVGGGWGAEEVRWKPRLAGREAKDYFALGAEYLRRLEFKKAIAPLERAVQLNPRFIAAYRALGEAYAYAGVMSQEDGQPDAVLLKYQRRGASAFEKAHQLAPKDAGLAFNLGVLCFNTGQYEKAVDAFQAGLHTLRPGKPARISLKEGGGNLMEVYGYLGRALMALDQKEKAVDAFKQGLAVEDPEANPRDLQEELAPLYASMGLLDQALATYQALLPTEERAARWGTDPELYLALANLHLRRKDPSAAAEAFGKAAVELQRECADHDQYPPTVDATDADRKEWQAKGEALREGVVRALYNAGVADLQAGHTQAASAAFQRVLVLDPLHSGARFNLGFTLHALGDQAGAEAQVRRLAEGDPAAAAELARLIAP